MNFDEFLRPFFSLEDQRSTEEKYKELRKRVIGKFANDRRRDPEDCADEVFRRILEELNRGPIHYPKVFLWNTVELVLHEARRRDRKDGVLPETPVKDKGKADHTEVTVFLREVLGMVSPEEAALLRSRYVEGGRSKSGTDPRQNSRVHAVKEKLRQKLGLPKKKAKGE